jgi:hypothetical protein
MSNTPETDKIFALKHNYSSTYLMEEMRKMEMKIIDMKAQMALLEAGVKQVKKQKETKETV